jgi:hypothetical protein
MRMQPRADSQGLPAAIVYLQGQPTPAADRVADAMLRLRPGVFFVVGPAERRP